ncbi:MAG: phosphoribosylglycinamide formyltransferase [Dysgonamonadaceae bacterium]|jgi:phosphoribosylglycinamide formyltransferase-1|nr:phosphoribosylglycinamide formyltransferase [Dysgonamonadaceae bacterium]MDD3355989.1 phosphoribosylglycinamide formyltransferase [Dysgonamonadaceae bacterium]MDD3728427.1 phosphoribosylglycinamide formyltransferase [Dysgonamonadaceae bacterium]MDD4246854.1 phosphoribosylglycinamide formyltransferase [Dysgonamonadaceae bacterium]MDD4606045.1 phosphoribosylglycinamide formyltransferase [Dysgonamonadaceae bacterium]
MTKIALFASGSGTNAENIARYFAKNRQINVSLVISNKADAYVHRRAKALDIPSYSFTNEQFREGTQVLTLLLENKIDFIVLAGFLLKVPDLILKKYPNKIINIHPALLPKYGGKGMYGDRVHKKVIEMGDTKSGITIHYVNDKYDEGEIIFQDSFDIDPKDTYQDIAEKAHKLEYTFFPRIIEEIILGKR